MILLYGHIFRTIRQRARLSLQRRRSQMPAGDRRRCRRRRNSDDHEEEGTQRPGPLANSGETTFTDLVSDSNAGRSHSQDGAFSADEEFLVREQLFVSINELPEPSFVAENGRSTEHVSHLLTDIDRYAEQIITLPPGEYEPNDNRSASTEKGVLLSRSECIANNGGGCLTIERIVSPHSEYKTNDNASSSAEQRNVSPPSECRASDTSSAKVTAGSRRSTVTRRRKCSGLSAVERKTTKTLAIVLGIRLLNLLIIIFRFRERLQNLREKGPVTEDRIDKSKTKISRPRSGGLDGEEQTNIRTLRGLKGVISN